MIFLDSGALFGPSLHDLSTRQLLNLCKDKRVEVHVSEVVIRELERQYREGVVGASDAVTSKMDRFHSLDPTVEISTDFEGLRAAADSAADGFLARTASYFHDHGVIIDSVPVITVSELLRRDLANNPPFRDGKGMRDAIIWSSMLEVCKSNMLGDDVVFVTTDAEDYFKNGDLNPVLRREFDEALPDCSISVSRSVNDVLRLIPEDSDDFARFVSLYESEPSVRENIQTSMLDLYQSLKNQVSVFLSDANSAAYLGEIRQIGEIRIDSVYHMARNRSFVGVRAEVITNVSASTVFGQDTEAVEFLFNDDQPPLLVTSTMRNRILRLTVVGEWSWDEGRIGQLEAVSISYQDE